MRFVVQESRFEVWGSRFGFRFEIGVWVQFEFCCWDGVEIEVRVSLGVWGVWFRSLRFGEFQAKFRGLGLDQGVWSLGLRLGFGISGLSFIGVKCSQFGLRVWVWVGSVRSWNKVEAWSSGFRVPVYGFAFPVSISRCISLKFRGFEFMLQFRDRV